MEQKRASGQRPKKRRFVGNQFVLKNRSSRPHSKPNLNESASNKKLSSSTILANEVSDFQGYSIMDKKLVFDKIAAVVCCKICSGEISIKEYPVAGLSSSIHIQCNNCEDIASFRNSKMVGELKKASDINRRFTYAMRCIGQGHTAIKTFSGIMDLPPPTTQCSYQNVMKKIRTASNIVAQQSMKEAAKEEVALTGSTDVSASGDGTWKTRGHTSLLGAVTMIGVETGKAIDVEVMSSFCKACDQYKDVRQGEKYEIWKKSHEEKCVKNHDGSAGKMEMDGMVRIFERSIREREIRYVNYIGDGDAKTFSAIVASKPYGDSVAITKTECVNHVMKRMGFRLRKLKEKFSGKKLSDGKAISGKGRLTGKLIDSLQTYYAKAIYENSSSVEDMRKAVWATFCHKSATDEDPSHFFCPKEETTWCKYQKAVFCGKQKDYKHKNNIPSAIMDIVKPIYRDLSHPELLTRCLGKRTQNTNECLNSVIWKFCPKVSNCGRIIAEIAVNEAVVSFNNGSKGRLKIMKALDIDAGLHAVRACILSDSVRVQTAEKRFGDATLESRRDKKRTKTAHNRETSKKEGHVYQAGGF